MRTIASRRACPELAEGMVQLAATFAPPGASFETPRSAAPQDEGGLGLPFLLESGATH